MLPSDEAESNSLPEEPVQPNVGRPSLKKTAQPRSLFTLAAGIILLACLLTFFAFLLLGPLFERDRDEGHATATNIVPPPVTPTPRLAPSPEPAASVPKPSLPSMFDFEGGVSGWKIGDQGEAGAFAQLSQSQEQALDGEFSLRVEMKLDGGEAQKSSGEVWVDLRQQAPAGLKAPLDLSERTVTAWVYAPPNSAGDTDRPNGFQVFVKDKKWKAAYGKWENVQEGRWNKISLVVGASRPEGGHLDSEFDATQIIGVGVKMGTGGGSKAKYSGAIHVDAVSW